MKQTKKETNKRYKERNKQINKGSGKEHTYKPNEKQAKAQEDT